jgi:uncharacterized RDD family membrane protein YckC
MSTNGQNELVIYFNKNDYASMFKRTLVILIDLFIVGIVGYILSSAWTFWADSPDFELISEFGWMSAALFSPVYFWTLTLMAYLYLAILKRSRFGTIGYRILKLKIIDAKGNQPSLLRMSWRFLLLAFGPLNLLIDFLWLGGDNFRQTLRDKMAGTYVVSSDAKPAGNGTLVFERHNLLGLSMIFAEIKADNDNNLSTCQSSESR